MSKAKDKPSGLRALLARDHQELDRIFDDLSSALHADARDDTRRIWAVFEDGLCRHMALEEEHVLPLLRKEDWGEVEALTKEHEDIRAKLAELGVGVELHEVDASLVDDFVAQLRHHARREEALGYRWAEEHVPPADQKLIRSALAAARAVRQRLGDVGRKVKARVESRP